MTSILAFLVLAAFFGLLARYTSNDRFSSGPRPHDRFADSDAWMFHGVRRIL